MKKKLFCIVLFTSFSIFSVLTYGADFKDTANHSASPYIKKIADKGFISGYPDGTFQPDKPITRAEVVSILSKINFNSVDIEANFKDIQENDWFYQAVINSAKGGVISGYTDKTFQPQKNITRFEAISLLSKLVRTDNYNSVQLPYSDATDIPSWVSGSVRSLYAANIIESYPTNKINGNEAITRGEIVTMLTKLLESKDWNTSSIAATVFENVTNPLPLAVDIPHDLLGYLSIESIGIKSYPVKDGVDLATIKTALGHFADTALWDGNIGICGHNRDYQYDFRNLKNIKIGDAITYQSRFGERIYIVTEKKSISETDWSYLNKNSDVNKITLVTCIESQPSQRLLVQAVQK